MAAPPSFAGGVKVTETLPLWPVAVPMTGAPGKITNVTLLDAAEAAPVPALLVAVTVNVYAVPLARPLTVRGLLAPDPPYPPGLETAV